MMYFIKSMSSKKANNWVLQKKADKWAIQGLESLSLKI